MSEYEITPSRKFSLGIKELLKYRELFYFFSLRDIKVKYKQTVFGFAWAILQPLVMMALFTLFFGKALSVPSDSIPYPVFVLPGLLLWNIFSSGVSNAGNSMVTNANIIKKIYFPRLIIPLSSVLVALFDFLMALIIFIAVLFFYDAKIHLSYILWMPVAILITTLTTFGFGTWLAALNVKYRDFRYVIPFMLQALLFLSPVIYPTSVVSNQKLAFVLSLNPMAGAIGLFRAPFTGIIPDATTLILSGCSAIILFVAGIYYFRTTESYFADIA